MIVGKGNELFVLVAYHFDSNGRCYHGGADTLSLCAAGWMCRAAEAEEQPQETPQEEKAEETPEEKSPEEESSEGKSPEEESPEEEEEAPAEEEEEEEEELVDPKAEIENSCKPKCVKQLLALQVRRPVLPHEKRP